MRDVRDELGLHALGLEAFVDGESHGVGYFIEVHGVLLEVQHEPLSINGSADVSRSEPAACGLKTAHHVCDVEYHGVEDDLGKDPADDEPAAIPPAYQDIQKLHKSNPQKYDDRACHHRYRAECFEDKR